ncbi:NDUFB9, NADH-ubiquinone oxidoreductase [Russula ochroleuca]|uniref:NADH dehydrogenase [ubiquinone] 1 beta subcomplex subunit 9 n=1 Tax=Russula ochroleuca TaxID=152965 RepID=A0A9P5JU81_9AGAM|nr:NDUFB9, NADH-ubiquinone oxidoreductase [Russula ochroleuca]
MSASPFSAAHRRYVKSLYKRMLENERNWVVRYDLYRARACAVRAEFERNRNVHDPRALAAILEKAEEELARKRHPDPYIHPTFPGGTKWERNLPVCAEPLIHH